MSLWKIQIDWDNDGDYTTAGNDVTNFVIGSVGFSFQIGLRPFAEIGDETLLVFEVDNAGQQFSIENASSPYFGKLTKNKAVRVLFNGTTIWTGLTQVIKPKGMKHAAPTATITCASNVTRLKSIDFYPKLYTNFTVDEIAQDIALQSVFVPSTAQGWLLGVATRGELGVSTVLADINEYAVLDAGLTTFSYGGDNFRLDEKGSINAYEVLRQCALAEGGRIFFNRTGKLVFWNRYHLINSATTPSLTIDNSHQAIDYALPESEFSNRIDVEYQPRTLAAASGILWQSSETISLYANEVISFVAKFADSSGNQVGADAIETPAIADSTLTVGSGGVTVSVGNLGQAANVTLTAGSSGAVITYIAVKAKQLSAKNKAKYVAQDNENVRDYGERAYVIRTSLMDSLNNARNLAEYELARRKNPNARAKSITLERYADSTDNADLINYGIGDYIRIIDDQLSHDANYYIVGEQHSISQAGLMHRVTWSLEPQLSNIWALGVADFGELGETTVLGY